MDFYRISTEYHNKFESNKWRLEIPYINFPSDYEIKIIPPINSAVIRFLVKYKNSDNEISVYLDCYDLLASFGEPYWECYSTKFGDVIRCKMNDTEQLLININELLGNKRKFLNK